MQTGVGQLVTFDVNALVQSWLADPAMHFGVQLAQQSVVEVPQPDGQHDRYRASVYASSAMADASIRPCLDRLPIEPDCLPASRPQPVSKENRNISGI